MASPSDRNRLFGETLRRLFKQSNLTQAELAKRCGCSHSIISLYLKGARVPRRDVLDKLCAALGCLPADRNQLMVAAGYAAISAEGLEVSHPAAVKAVAFYSNSTVEERVKQVVANQFEALVTRAQEDALAEQERLARHWEKAIRTCQAILQRDRLATAEQQWKTLNNLALAYYHAGRLVEASTAFHQCWDFSRLTGRLDRQIDDLTHIGDVDRTKGNWSEADRAYHDARRISEKLGSTPAGRRGVALADRKLAINLLFQGNAKSAEDLLKESLAEFSKLKDQYEVGKTHASLGWCYDFEGHWERALREKRLALKLSGEDPQDPFNIMKSDLYHGDSYFCGGRYDLALSSYDRARQASDQLGDRLERPLISLGLANCYRARGEFTSALREYQNSVVAAAQIHSDYRQALADLGIGTCLTNLPDRLAEARRHLDMASETFGALATPYYHVLTLAKRIEYLAKVGDLAQAQQDWDLIQKKLRQNEWLNTAALMHAVFVADAKRALAETVLDGERFAQAVMSAYELADRFNAALLEETHINLMEAVDRGQPSTGGHRLAPVCSAIATRMANSPEAVGHRPDISQAWQRRGALV